MHEIENARPREADTMADVERPPGAHRPFAQWVIFGCLYAFGVPWAIGSSFAFAGGLPLGIYLENLAFIVSFLLAGAFSFRGQRWAFAMAAGVSALNLIVDGPFFANSFAHPAVVTFVVGMLGLPLLSLAIVFGVLAFVKGKTGIARKAYLAQARSSGGFLTMAVVGFVVGGLVVGALGAADINRLASQPGVKADVEIVSGAATSSLPFSPSTLTVAVGATVTWLNRDNMEHSITSDTGAFDSGLLSVGATWSHTFTQPGTYGYHCSPHPWMKGTIVVTGP